MDYGDGSYDNHGGRGYGNGGYSRGRGRGFRGRGRRGGYGGWSSYQQEAGYYNEEAPVPYQGRGGSLPWLMTSYMKRQISPSP